MSTRCMRVCLPITIGLVLPIFASGANHVEKVAAEADHLLRQEVPFASTIKLAPPRIDDERFLRRASLDLVGRLPTPEEVTVFALDPSADKRSKIVEKLLADSRFG